MKKISVILAVIILSVSFCVKTAAVSQEEVRAVLNAAIMISSFCGPI